MYTNLILDEPIERVLEDWDYLQEKVIGRFSTFGPEGQNIYGIRQRTIGDGTVIDPRKGAVSAHYELGPDGLHVWQHSALKLHITLSGVPHRVQHNFGYWHINDMDELYLPLPSPEPDVPGYFLICMGNPGAGETDRFAWYCSECFTLMFERQFQTGDKGFAGFWKAERDAVSVFNSDPRHQVCPECGHVNPKGYCWNTAKDLPEEQQNTGLPLHPGAEAYYREHGYLSGAREPAVPVG
jgi:hypothetical protein